MERREWRDADEAAPPPRFTPGPRLEAMPLQTVETQLARAVAASNVPRLLPTTSTLLSLPPTKKVSGGDGGKGDRDDAGSHPLLPPPPDSIAAGVEVEVRWCTAGSGNTAGRQTAGGTQKPKPKP